MILLFTLADGSIVHFHKVMGAVFNYYFIVVSIQGISVFLPLVKSVKYDIQPHPTVLSVL